MYLASADLGTDFFGRWTANTQKDFNAVFVSCTRAAQVCRKDSTRGREKSSLRSSNSSFGGPRRSSSALDPRERTRERLRYYITAYHNTFNTMRWRAQSRAAVYQDSNHLHPQGKMTNVGSSGTRIFVYAASSREHSTDGWPNPCSSELRRESRDKPRALRNPCRTQFIASGTAKDEEIRQGASAADLRALFGDGAFFLRHGTGGRGEAERGRGRGRRRAGTEEDWDAEELGVGARRAATRTATPPAAPPREAPAPCASPLMRTPITMAEHRRQREWEREAEPGRVPRLWVGAAGDWRVSGGDKRRRKKRNSVSLASEQAAISEQGGAALAVALRSTATAARPTPRPPPQPPPKGTSASGRGGFCEAHQRGARWAAAHLEGALKARTYQTPVSEPTTEPSRPSPAHTCNEQACVN
ncbi:hypothetical protein FB451DRAFT_1376239 [Mycena latifolia]|nr:hypothetical protein FB451DRAFT_1376239 [Mycena latifolia]